MTFKSITKKISNIFVFLLFLSGIFLQAGEARAVLGADWTEATSSAAWSARSGHASVVFDNKMWVIGGSDSSGTYNDVWYSSDGVTWTQAPDASWSARYGHTSVVFNDEIWVMGGAGASVGSYFDDIWHSSDGLSWTKALPTTPYWSARPNHTSVVFNGEIWVMGGYGFASNKNDVWHSSSGSSWTQAPDAGWSDRQNHTSVVFDNKMWVMGGSYNNDVWWSSDGESWTRATANANWSDRQNHTSIVFDDKMWVMGGVNAGNYFNDVWYSELVVPTCTITASSLSILSGNSSDLTWDTLNATSATISDGVTTTPLVGLSGIETVSPITDTTYTITATDGTNSGTCSATVTILPTPPPPPPTPTGGIVPCGREFNDPATSWDDTADCQLCHFIILADNMIDLLMKIVAIIAILALVIGGLIYVKSSGNTSLILVAKQNFNKILYGFVIVFIAWVAVNAVMTLFSFSDPSGDGSWAIFTCNIP